MKLQLTVFAQDLKVSEETANTFAVVSVLKDGKAQVLGKTESLKNTDAPDFTKIFVLDYLLGQHQIIQVTLMMDANNNANKIATATYNVAQVLGTKGGVVGKALDQGYLMVHIEKSSGLGTLQLELKGVNLVSDQDVCDPYLELQTKRRILSKNNGDKKEVWDVVFRSMPVFDTVNPTFAPMQLDYGMLCHRNKNVKKPKKVRIVVKDYDDRDDTTIGSCLVTVPQLQEMQQLSKDAIDLDQAIPLKRHKHKVGELVVVTAKIVDGDEEEVPLSTSRAAPTFTEEEEEDIDLSAPSSTDDDDIVLLPEGETATFADYIAGGCQLKVVVAIDYTASNGDPRKEQSLHYFTKDGSKNEYETCMHMICSILSQYDSDQKYSVYGFGAKKGGTLSHCFALSGSEVDGVDGILKAYKDAFKSGLAMSKPTNICEVIKTAGKDAKTSLDAALKKESQEYTILTIFTNGNVHNVSETVKALQSVKDDPISVVVVGVGPSQFEDMGFLKDHHEKDGLRVHFVDAKAYQGDELTSQTLSPTPNQLESYFGMKEIMPNPPIEADEIVILPNNGNDGFADVTVGENGDIQLEAGPAGNAANGDTNNNSATSSIPEPLQNMGEQGKKFFLQQAKRQFGRVSKQMTRNMNRMIDQKVNQMFGIKNATGGGRRRNGRR